MNFYNWKLEVCQVFAHMTKLLTNKFTEIVNTYVQIKIFLFQILKMDPFLLLLFLSISQTTPQTPSFTLIVK